MSREIWIGLVAALVILGAVIGYPYLQKALQTPAQSAETASAPVADADDEQGDDDAIQHPVPEVPTTPPLPALTESDNAFHAGLTAVFALAPIESLLVPQQLVQKIVVTLNSLDGQGVPLRLWPLRNLPQLPTVTAVGEGVWVFNPENSQRYARYVTVVKAVDAEALAKLYLRYYPLFQQAYVELGFPDRYFNDRLVAVLDHLLVTPVVAGPIRLKRPKVLYEYESDNLQALSAGQKLLIRMGPENAAIVKDKIKQFRDAVVAASKGVVKPAAEPVTMP